MAKPKSEKRTVTVHTLDGRPFHVARLTLSPEPRTYMIVDSPKQPNEITPAQANVLLAASKSATTRDGRKKIHVGDTAAQEAELAAARAEIERLTAELKAARGADKESDKPTT